MEYKTGFYVYKITNKLNNKVYIGSTSTTPKNRWGEHIKAAFGNESDHHHNYPLMIAFREFGIDNFSFDVIDEYCCKDEMCEAEQYYIDLYNCKVPNGYNQTRQTIVPCLDPEIAKKMKIHHRKVLGKPVCELLNGTIINKWGSIAEAAESTKISKTFISSVCRGVNSSAYGRVFAFIDKDNNVLSPSSFTIDTSKGKKISNSLRQSIGRRVALVDSEGNTIKVFNSCRDAAEFSHIDPRRISDVCKGKKKSYKGQFFKYIDSSYFNYYLFKIVNSVNNFSYYGGHISCNKISLISVLEDICNKRDPNDAFFINDLLSVGISNFNIVTLKRTFDKEEYETEYSKLVSSFSSKNNVYNNIFYECDFCELLINFSNELHEIKTTNIYKMKNNCSKEVLQYDLKGNLLHEYPSIYEASRSTGINARRISYMLNGHSTICNNFIFVFKDSDFNIDDLCNKAVTKCTRVHRTDEDGNILETFESIHDACEKYSLLSPCVSYVCQGIYKHTKGYHFKYAE